MSVEANIAFHFMVQCPVRIGHNGCVNPPESLVLPPLTVKEGGDIMTEELIGRVYSEAFEVYADCSADATPAAVDGVHVQIGFS